MDCTSTDLTFDEYLTAVDALVEEWYSVPTDPEDGDWKYVGEAYADGKAVEEAANYVVEKNGLADMDYWRFPDAFPD